MLFGEYYHQIDQKGRVRIPGKLKSALGEGFVVSKGTGGCIFLLPKSTLDNQIADKVDAVPLSDISASNPLRMLFASIAEVEEDNQGRTMLPKNLREFAKLNKDIVFIGVGNRAEIWSREAYDKQFAEADFDKALSGLKEYGV
jgi:MraZ protein